MRTLKKSLALVLALVMLLGLGVVGASADNALDNYTDADEIGDAYLEAVGVLTGLGIVDGMTETTIVPQATYTRAQAAKIITTMVLGVNGAKSCVASYAPFDDVAANHWAAGYIAFCKEQGHYRRRYRYHLRPRRYPHWLSVGQNAPRRCRLQR